MLFNWSANTDPQLQEAASPQVLRSGCLQRYASITQALDWFLAWFAFAPCALLAAFCI